MTTARPATGTRRRVATLLVAAFAVATAGVLATTAAPVAAASGTGTGPNGQTVTVSDVDDLDPEGATVTVTGAGFTTANGFDPSILGDGIYLAVCVDNGVGEVPTPCIGGVDTSGESTASRWITNSGVPGLTVPMNSNGTFSTTLTIAASDENTDCFDLPTGKQCKVFTRMDHRAGADRSQDVRVPVTFGEAAAGPELSLSPATGVDPDGEDIVVTGTGYPVAGPGVYVVYGPEPENGTDATPYQRVAFVPSAAISPEGSFTTTLTDVEAVYTGEDDVDYDFSDGGGFVSTFRAHGQPDPDGLWKASEPVSFQQPGVVTVTPSTGLDRLGTDVVVNGVGFSDAEPGFYVVYGPASGGVSAFQRAVAVDPEDLGPGGTFSVTLTNVTAQYTSGGTDYDFQAGGGFVSTFRAQGQPDPHGLWATSTPVGFAPYDNVQAFVTAAITDFLGRPPTKQERAAGVSALTGGQSRTSYLRALSTSDQWLTGVIDRLYLDTLGRPSDPGGRAFWLGELRRGVSVARVAAGFYSASEYFQNIGGGTVRTWIEDLYLKILLRNGAADPGGVNYWISEVAAKGRGNVAYRFFQSEESARTRVKALYVKLLGRPGDTAGIDHWAPLVVRNGDLTLAVNLASGPEYYGRANQRFP